MCPGPLLPVRDGMALHSSEGATESRDSHLAIPAQIMTHLPSEAPQPRETPGSLFLQGLFQKVSQILRVSTLPKHPV